jgi:hypothetical protein
MLSEGFKIRRAMPSTLFQAIRVILAWDATRLRRKLALMFTRTTFGLQHTMSAGAGMWDAMELVIHPPGLAFDGQFANKTS